MARSNGWVIRHSEKFTVAQWRIGADYSRTDARVLLAAVDRLAGDCAVRVSNPSCCGNYLSGMRAWIQSPMREAEGLSRLHNTITDWLDSGYTRRSAFIPGAPPPWP